MIVVNSRFLTKEVTGIVRYASELTPHLKKLCDKIIFVTHKGVKQKYLADQLEAVEYGKLKGYYWEQLELPLFLEKLGNPSLLNLSNTGPFFYRDQITVIHDVAFIKNPDWYSYRAAIAFKVIISRMAKISRRVITLSEYTKHEVIRYLNIPDSKISVIKANVPQRIISLSGNEYKNHIGEYFLTVSSLQPRKNIPGLISAFNQLQSCSLKLVIVGSENKRIFSDPVLNKSDNPNIIFTGFLSDEELTGLYKNAKLFIYPSFYEGFGFPPLEALACGCPVLASNTSSLPEVCGNAVNYFNPYNLESLTVALKRKILNNDKVKFRLTDQINNKLSWEDSAKMILDVIEES